MKLNFKLVPAVHCFIVINTYWIFCFFILFDIFIFAKKIQMSKAQLQYSTPSSSKLSIKKDDETNNNDTLQSPDLLPRDQALDATNEDEEAESSKFQDYYGIVVESR